MAVQITNSCFVDIGEYDKYDSAFERGVVVFNVSASDALVIVVDNEDQLNYLRKNHGTRPTWEPGKSDFSTQIKNIQDAMNGIKYDPEILSFHEAQKRGVI